MSEWEREILNPGALAWVKEMADLCQPQAIHVCTGSNDEKNSLCQEMVKKGTFTPLNPLLRPNSFLARSDPEDVARVEERTFICSEKEEDAGPTNHWRAPQEMKAHLLSLFKGCMRGRTLYVVPFSMGPHGSPLAKMGIQITDSPYATVSMRIMTRMGKDAWEGIQEKGFVPCLHSLGVPLEQGVHDVAWPCNPSKCVIAHFPESRSIWSYGSGYGGNALLGKKCLALRIGSVMAKEEGWLAEHMLIMGVTNPQGKKKYFAASFPSACGKTNLAMMTPTLPGWKVETVGDDIAWMKLGSDGRLYAINPEAGFFGVAPGTSIKTNPNAMGTIHSNSIFTNVALTDEGDVWWEGMTEPPPAHLISWKGRSQAAGSLEKAAHPNSRFTAPARQCPCIDPHWESPQGVPIEAIIFGGRRSKTLPLVVESFDWNHGVFFGASLSSETTAASVGQLGQLRHDPFAMLPFCGYNMGDYFNHWLQFGASHPLLPRIYYVNWFRKDKEGKWLWPGFGENSRVLKWCFERIDGEAGAKVSPIGRLPLEGSLDLQGLNLPQGAFQELFKIEPDAWMKEAEELTIYFKRFGNKLPQEILRQIEQLKSRIANVS